MKFKQKKSFKTLSDKIADALTVKASADIEDDLVFGTKPKTLSRADFSSSESEDEATISDFRKRSVNLLSEISKKYEGQVDSRKALQEKGSEDSEDSDQSVESEEKSNSTSLPKGTEALATDSESSNIDEEEVSPKKSSKNHETDSESDDGEDSVNYNIMQLKKQINDSDEVVEEDNEDQSDADSEDVNGYDISQLDEPMPEKFEHMKKQNLTEEAKIGASVRNQLLLWEGLLEMRIHLQRCVATANQMPLPETHEQLKGNSEFDEECNTAKATVTNVLDKLLSLQSTLLKGFPDTKSISKIASKRPQKDEKQEEKKPESDEEIPSDTEDEEIPSDTEDEHNTKKQENSGTNPSVITAKKRKLEDYEKDIAITQKAFKGFRDSTIQKWNDKTRLGAAASTKNIPSNTIMQQISYILSDHNKLVRRTQLKRSEYDIVGYKIQSSDNDIEEENGTEINPVIRDRKEDDQYITEIFDDSDFYHQLLRELIECKSADISDPVQLSRQWIALQQMRSKMKRKVDTKATKGRKIKYVVHNPLVNYMAPEKSTTWSEESVNELYSSLFGKLFESNNVGLNVNLIK